MELSQEDRLFNKGYKTIPMIARKHIKGDPSGLEGYLLEKLIHVLRNKLDHDLPFYMKWKYISRSLNCHAKNFFRDHSRAIRLPRSIHDRYQQITAYKKKYARLKPSKEEICTALGIGTLEYDEALSEYNLQLMPIDAFNGNIGVIDRGEPEENALINSLSDEDKRLIEKRAWSQVSPDGKETLRLLGASFD